MVVRSCLDNPEAHLGAKRERIESFPSAAHANQIGTAINRSILIVSHASLSAAVCDRHVGERYPADAQGGDVVKIGFQNQPIVGELVARECVEEELQLRERCGEPLTEGPGAQWFLYPNGSART